MALFEVDGVNNAPQPYEPEYDHHCPEMGSKRHNYYKVCCQLRQRDPQQRKCFRGCKSFRRKK